MKNLYELTIKEAAELLKKGEISSFELVQSCLKQIKKVEPEIHAYITLNEERALEQAKEIDIRRKKHEKLSDLAGIPYSAKDVYCTKGLQTTAGSKVLEGYIPQYTATVISKLNDVGAILLGKTNCDAFGFGTSTEHSGYGVTKNPIDTERVPGGSSGGSAAAVQYGGGLFSIAEDTGGSIRCPASFCGVAGLKVTYGRVSRYGAISYARSYDTVGPIAKNTEDLAMILEVIAGHDPHDATSSNEKVQDYSKLLDRSIKGLKIGIPKEYFQDGLDEEVKEIVEKAIEKYKSLGCEIKSISLPYTEYAIAAYYVVGLSEASANLARFDGIRYGPQEKGENWMDIITSSRGKGFGEEEKRRIMIGTYALSAGYADEFYKKAQKVRELIKNDLLRALKEVDIILTPTMPVLPFKFGENDDDPLKMWLADAYTVTLNPSGLPGLSVNAGWSKDGLPVGMQLIGPHFREDLLLNFGHKYENEK